ncbi:hypothetical protein DY000_02030265 [Brassica cretica]|uniref:Uncharacterized protein n=1 Tax=Brassica cretica TaxID=69181 RepID=A0ABQ7DR04_BRACR|nr:hypothetical protein DY000_02030265 [Brassica cretica]
MIKMESLNDETKDSACFTRKFYVKSAKAPARIEKGKLWLLDQLFKKHVYGVRAGAEKMYNVFHNQFLVALKRLQVDKQELVHKSANETVVHYLLLFEIAYSHPTTFRRNSDGCKAVRRNTVGIFQSQTAIKRSYIFVGNGHMVVGNSSANSDGIPTTVIVIFVNRNVVGSSSVYSDEFPTTTTVMCFIGMSSKSRRKIRTSYVSSDIRRKWPTEFRRLQIFCFRRKLVGNPSQTSDDIEVCRNLHRNSAYFLVVVVEYSRNVLQLLHDD